MPIKIHGKEYLTVADRVNTFRQDYPLATIKTKLVSADDSLVVVKASIIVDGVVISTGYAEEDRNAGMINKTSALENCETSAVGRALAFFGLAGTEIASANEVQNAIAQQSAFRWKKGEKDELFVAVKTALDNMDDDKIKDLFSIYDTHESKTAAWYLFDAPTRAKLKEALK